MSFNISLVKDTNTTNVNQCTCLHTSTVQHQYVQYMLTESMCCCACATMPVWVKHRLAEAADTGQVPKWNQACQIYGHLFGECSSTGYYGMIRGEGEAPSPAKINTAVENNSAFPAPRSISTKPLSPNTSSFVSKSFSPQLPNRLLLPCCFSGSSVALPLNDFWSSNSYATKPSFIPWESEQQCWKHWNIYCEDQLSILG